jgi:hypothetical protein
VNGEGDEILVFEVDTSSQEVDCCLGSTVGRNSKGNVLHISDSSDSRGNDHESRVRAFLKKRQDSLEETDDAGCVDVEMLH